MSSAKPWGGEVAAFTALEAHPGAEGQTRAAGPYPEGQGRH